MDIWHYSFLAKIIGFNAKWKPQRPFPIDMAAFAVNITLILDHQNSHFSYNVSGGYLVSLLIQKAF